MNEMATQLTNPQRSGLYQLVSAPEEVERAAKEAGLAVFRIEIKKVQDKADFLNRIAQALSFPDWFGMNWDALNDCLGDLDWLPAKTGYVLIFENSDDFRLSLPHEFKVTTAILQTAAEYWKSKGRPFWAFIHLSRQSDSGLAKWPA